MAQNLVTLFGSGGAARFLELLASNYRKPVWKLEALNADGTVYYDATDYLSSFQAEFSDEIASTRATYTLANPNAIFDPFSGASTAAVFRKNRILRFKKGLIDPVNGDVYLLPAHYGQVIDASPRYAFSDSTITVTAADVLKHPLREKFTSALYINCNANIIAADILKRFGKFIDAQIALADVDKAYSFVQFPDMTLVDALKALYDPILFSIRADEAGRIATAPRLGSDLSAFAGLLGYPDQTSAPTPTYTIADTTNVVSANRTVQDWDGIVNQVKVLGQTAASQRALGPMINLHRVPNSSIGARDSLHNFYLYQQTTGLQNSVIADNVFVEFWYSTNGTLDAGLRKKFLSLMTWLGAWDSERSYDTNQAVEWGGNGYACKRAVVGAATGLNPSTDGTHWQPLIDSQGNPFTGPFVTATDLYNEDPRLIGYVRLVSTTEDRVVLYIEGRQYSVGGSTVGKIGVRHRGGFDYRFYVYGMPVLSQATTITAYADYNPVTVTGEELVDLFGDHRTYQAAHQPFAMSQAIQVFVDTGSGPQDMGIIRADQTVLTGEVNYNVDFERGRIVFNGLTYQEWSVDNTGSHPLSSGGTANTTSTVFDLSLISAPAPQVVYQSSRQGEIIYTLTGLAVGQGYDINLHFADPDVTRDEQRKFTIYINGNKAIEGFDIHNKAGATYAAYIETLSGIRPTSMGVITIGFHQYDPVTGTRLPECPPQFFSGGFFGTPILPLVCGIEVVLPQGQGASPYAINCGGPALTATPPIVTASYGYSPVQEEYQIQQMEINAPLLTSQEECATVGEYWVNYSQWDTNRDVLETASLPHLQPGDVLKYYDAKLNRDFYAYIKKVSRSMAKNSPDTDTFSVNILRAASR